MTTKDILAESGAPLREMGGTKWWLISGVGVGLLNVISAVALNFKLGITTAFSASYKHLLEVVDPSRALANPYLAKLPPAGDWEIFLLVGLVAGAYIAYKNGPRLRVYRPKLSTVQALKAIGARRFALVLLGTFLLGYGARLAGGCTTGHILSGWAQLSIGSLAFGLIAFPVAIVTANALYGKWLGGP